MTNLNAEIDEDGIVKYHDIETYYRPWKSMHIDKSNGFLAVVMDDGPVDLETRVPIDELVGFLKREGFVQ